MLPRRRFGPFAPLRRLARAGIFTGLGFAAGRATARPPEQATASVEARLAELDRLLASGAISASEHAERRQEILRQI